MSTAGGGRLTETGLSVGIPYYMSPEQASADREPTAASDIYSLGCVLYEMLVGDPPFTGGTAQAVLAKILTAKAPEATVARPAIPANIDAAIRRALERLPADRFARAGDFASALSDPSFRHGEAPGVALVSDAGPWKRMALAAAAIAAVSVAVAGRSLVRRPPPARVTRFATLIEPGTELARAGDFTIAPDGSFIVYVGPAAAPGRPPRLWVRRFRDLEAVPIDGTEGFQDLRPSISPDGLEVAFGGRSSDGVKTVRVDGGPVR